VRAELQGALREHDGEKALTLLEQLAKLSGDLPEAADEAMKLALDINRDVHGAGEMGLATTVFHARLATPAMRDLMIRSLENPAASTSEFRVLAAWSLPWMTSPEETSARLETALGVETDPDVQAALVGGLAMMKTPKAAAALMRVFTDRERDAGLRSEAVMALATSKDPAVQRAVETAASGDSEPRVQAAAKVALIARDPPATGCLVTQTTPDGAADSAGIKAGDVLVSYGGRAVATDAELRREIQAVTTQEPVPVVVVRDGRSQTMHVKPGRLGLTSRGVRKP
jgi:hypothetical protein